MFNLVQLSMKKEILNLFSLVCFSLPLDRLERCINFLINLTLCLPKIDKDAPGVVEI